MLTNLIIGKMTKDLDYSSIVDLGFLEMGDCRVIPEAGQVRTILKLPKELHQWVESLDDGEDSISIIATNASVIHAALLTDRVPMENIWLALPFDKPTSFQKLVDILERDWLAHFCIASMWMSGRLEHEVNEALKEKNS